MLLLVCRVGLAPPRFWWGKPHPTLYSLGTMPLVPLYDETAPPAALHAVSAPGGYETWRLVAYDPTQDLLLLMAIWHGDLLGRDYAYKYYRYLRSPTVFPPPQPKDFPVRELSLYKNGRLLTRSLVKYPLDPMIPFPTLTKPTRFGLGRSPLRGSLP